MGGGQPLITIGVGYLYTGTCQKQSPPFSVTRSFKQDEGIKAKFEKIPAHGSKKWTFDLRATLYARSNTYGSEGVYDLSKPGTYFLMVALGQDGQSGLTSKEIPFVVQ